MSMSASSRYQELMKFRRFRLNLIGFLKLPPDVEERALRNVIHECSENLLASYLARAQRAREVAVARAPGAEPLMV